ncbi:MAG: imidazole glycerol phosphate synthase subunit HisH [Dehalococcoidia bacterium]
MPPRVVIVDYGAGNLRSVARAVAHAGHEPTVTDDPEQVDAADALIVPGVGAAADTMRNLREHRMVEPIREYIASGRPFFGVCMGQQALLSISEEGGEHECLGIIPGRVKKLDVADGRKVPHMGWNNVRQKSAHPIFDGIPDDAYFYFVHSYYPQPEDPDVVIGETDYGVTFASVLARDNIVATQFHPEKSGEMGLRMYANFLSFKF